MEPPPSDGRQPVRPDAPGAGRDRSWSAGPDPTFTTVTGTGSAPPVMPRSTRPRDVACCADPMKSRSKDRQGVPPPHDGDTQEHYGVANPGHRGPLADHGVRAEQCHASTTHASDDGDRGVTTCRSNPTSSSKMGIRVPPEVHQAGRGPTESVPAPEPSHAPDPVPDHHQKPRLQSLYASTAEESGSH